MLSPESERFSEAAGAAAAGCSFFCLAVFFAGLAGASAFEAAAASPSRESVGGGTAFDSVVVCSSGLGLVGFSGSAIILTNQIKLCRLWLPDCAPRLQSCVGPCVSGHLSMCAVHARASPCDVGCRDKS